MLVGMAEKMGCCKENSKAEKQVNRLCESKENEDVRIEGEKTQGQQTERVVC